MTIHDCPCCGQAVYSDDPTHLCRPCHTFHFMGIGSECDPSATWHCDGRNGHNCDGTGCEEYDTPTSLYAECGCIAPCPDHSPRQVGKDDQAYWADKGEWWGSDETQLP